MSHLNWIEGFQRRHGRAPRILHIGNIANNAYNNAKLLNDAGIECDVLCYDYYHIMGCPEWEDADFKGEVSNHFAPDWRQVNLKDFKRPRWFAQGPLWVCLQYLIARNQNCIWIEKIWWLILYPKRILFYERLKKRIRSVWDSLKTGSFFIPASALHQFFSSLVLLVFSLGFMLFSMAYVAIALLLGLGVFIVRPIASVRAWKQRRLSDFDRRVEKLIQFYQEAFPDREDRLTRDDFEYGRFAYPAIANLMRYYDLIEAYSTDVIYPMLFGLKPYVAYEHGTIRDIPFEKTSRGRLCALGYHLADFTVITNPDCIISAEKLKLKNYKYVPHVLDGKYHNETGLYQTENPLALKDPYIFCPSRHDWNEKGTHFAIQGFATFQKSNPNFKLVMSKWGQDILKSKELIESLGLKNSILFIEPLNICNLIRVTRQAYALIDQFVLFFGGIAPTALVLGTPLVTHIDFSKCAWCYDEEPPYFEASDAEKVYRSLLEIKDLDRSLYEQHAKDWVKRNYHYQSVTDSHLELYGKLLTYVQTPEPNSKKEAVAVL